jgi:hypothetical protein
MPKAAEYEYLIRVSEPDAPSTWHYPGSTHGRSTTSGDTPANYPMPGSLASPPTFQLSIFDGIDPVLNPRSSIGSIVLRDPTGKLDGSGAVTNLPGFIYDGGTLQLRRGTPGALYSGFTTVGIFTTAGLLYDHDTKEIRLQNLGRILETAALHDQRYTGAGSANGDANLTGQLKPYCIGQVFRIPPTLINASNLIYQVSCTAIEAIDAVHEGGVALTPSGTDRANYAAMAAAAPAAGEYDTCLAEGLFRLGASPTLDITANVQGDKTGGTYFEKRGDIAKQIVTRAGTALTSGQVNSTALSDLNTAKAETCGFFWNREITKAQALSEVMEGCLGYWWINLSGELMLGYLSAPGSSPVATYAFGTQTGLPSMKEVVSVPRWKTSISFQRNYSPVERSRLAGAVSDSDAQLYGQDAQWKYSENTTVHSKNPAAYEKRTYSGLWSGTDAQTEATAQNGLLDDGNGATLNERWRIPIYEDPFTLAGYVGQRIAISGYGRYGWANPRTFILIGVEWGAGLVPIATLWG